MDEEGKGKVEEARLATRADHVGLCSPLAVKSRLEGVWETNEEATTMIQGRDYGGSNRTVF